MPVFKHSVTGDETELSRDYAAAFPAGTWTLVEEVGPREQADKELQAALDNKVTVEDENGNELLPTHEFDDEPAHPPVKEIPIPESHEGDH